MRLSIGAVADGASCKKSNFNDIGVLYHYVKRNAVKS